MPKFTLSKTISLKKIKSLLENRLKKSKKSSERVQTLLKTNKKLRITTIYAAIGLVILIPIIVLTLRKGEQAAAWWDETYQYRKPVTVTVTSAASDVSNLETLLTIDTSALITAGKMQSDCDDMRFTSINGKLLPYYLSAGCNTTTTKIWVMADLVPKNSTTYIMYFYYGQPNVSSASDSDTLYKVAGLQGYWPMNENTGTSLSDLSSNNNTGNLGAGSSAPSWATGKYGYGLTFDGANDYMSVADTGASDTLRLNGASNLTVTGWVNITDLSASIQHFIYSKYNYSGSVGYSLLVTSSGGVRFDINGNQNSKTTTANPISAGNWYHVAGVFRNGNIMEIYVNGQLIEAFGISTTTLSSYTGVAAIGSPSNDLGNTSWTTYGTIDDVRVYNRAFTSSQVQQLYSDPGTNLSVSNSTIIPSTSFGTEEVSRAPIAYWKLDEGQGTTVTNSMPTSLSPSLIPIPLNGGPTNIDNASDFGSLADTTRHVVRTSGGTLYTFLNDGGSCEVWKSTDGSTWTEQDSSNNPACNTDNITALAIDSTNTLHLGYLIWDSGPPYQNRVKWQTFSTSTDTFGSAEEVTADDVGLENINIAIDSADKPHFALRLGGGLTTYMVYRNRVSGSWSTLSLLENLPYGAYGVGLAINEDNIPEISYISFAGASDADLSVAVGNANNASSFTIQDVDTTVNATSDQRGSNIAIDTSGNTWVAYVDLTTNYVTLVKHNDADGWSTWQTPVTNSNVGYEPSIAINGTSVYVFYVDENNDVKYDMYNGSTWLGETNLQTGTFKDVRAKWSYNHNTGGTSRIDYLYSDSTDVYWASLDISSAGGSAPDWKTEENCISGKCLYFDGSNNESLVLTDNSSLDFSATSSFTVGAWVRRSSTASAASYIITKADTANGGYKLWMDDSGDFCFGIDDDASWGPDISACTSAIDYDDQKWHYVVGVRDASATDKIFLYVDGAAKANTTDTTTGTLENTNAFYVGVDRNGTSNEWFGFIDEVKVYKYARSATQVRQDYNARNSVEGTSVQISESSDGGNISSGLVAYWRMNDSGIDAESETISDASGNGYTGTLFGDNATGDNGTGMTCTAAGKFGTACDFDGTDDSITTSLTLPAGTDVTVAAWVKTTSTRYYVVGNHPTSGNLWFLGIDRFSDYATFRYENNDSEIILNGATTVVKDGTWHHIAATASTAGAKLYVDGKLEISNTTAADWDGGTVYLGSQAGTTNFYTGSMDEIRIYNRTLSPAEVFDIYSYSPRPIAEYKLDEGSGTSTSDTSGNGNNGTLNGDASWSQGKYGRALLLDGNGDTVSISDNDTLDLGISDFTISAWIKGNSMANSDIYLGKSDGGSCSSTYGYLLGVFDSLYPTLYFCTTTGTHAKIQGTTTLSNGTWYYATVVVDRDSSTNTKFYLNGNPIATAVTDLATHTGSISNSVSMVIGSESDGASYWDGYVDDVKIYNYIRTPTQIMENYNGDHPVIGTPIGSTVLQMKLDEGYGTTAYDNSPQANNGTLGIGSSAPLWTNSGKNNRALDFDGTNDYVSMSDSSSLDFNDQDFTITGWFYRDTFTTDDMILAKRNGNAAGNQGYMVWVDDTTDKIDFEISDGTDEYDLLSTSTFTSTGWYYFAIVWDDDSAANTEIYVNGKDDNATDTGTIANIGDLSTGNQVRLGDVSDTGSSLNNHYFDGKLDDIKIYPFALTQDQINADYNQGKSFTMGAVSTASDGVTPSNDAARAYCVPGDTSTCNAPVGEWLFNENTGTTAYDTGTGGRNGTFGVSSAAPSWVAGKYGNGVRFNGSQYIDTSTQFSFSAATSFTLSGWFKFDEVAVGGWAIDRANGSDEIIDIYQNGDDISFVIRDDNKIPDNGLFATASNVLVANRWYYIVGVRDVATDNIYLYLDGVLKATATDTTGTTISPILRFGAHSSGTGPQFSLDNVRMYDYARSPAQIAWEYTRGAPVAWYKFDECQGTTINDWAPNSNGGFNGNNATLTVGASGTQTSVGTCQTSGAWFNGVAGKINSGMSFDGTDDYVSVADNDLIDFNYDKDFSVSIWFTTPSSGMSGTFDAIIEKWPGGATGYPYSIRWDSDEKIRAARYDQTHNPTIVSDQSYTDDDWHHVVFAKNGSTLSLYVDGILDGTTTDSTDTTTTNSGALEIAKQSSNYYSGKIDDARIFNYGLTAAQVKEIYNNGAVSFR